MMKKNMINLEKFYTNPKFPGSFSSPRKFFNEVKKAEPTIKYKSVVEFLQSQNSYTLHRQTQKPRKYRRVYTHHPNYLWQSDLLFYDKFGKENRSFKYLMCTIDTFSKVLYVSPMKTKTGKEAARVMEKLLKKNKPLFLQADKGSEFVNKDFLALLKKYKVKFYSSNSPLKASIVERVQLTLRRRITKLFTKQGRHNWIDHIDDIVDSYNNTYHRTIGMRPNEVSSENAADVLVRMYPENQKKHQIKKFKKGDNVRIQKDRLVFDKVSTTKGWSDEIFTIKKILYTVPITYEVADGMGDDIKGSFYASELQKVREDLFHIEKVIHQKKVRGKEKYLVKFVGYKDPYWVDNIHVLK